MSGELADPLLNSASEGHAKLQIPFPHMCAHTSPSFHQERCHTTICHSCTSSSSKEINPGTPFDGWILCFWRRKAPSISTSNINTARTVVPQGAGLQSSNKPRKLHSIAQPAHPKPKIKQLGSERHNSCISQGPWKYSDIILDSSLWPEPALNYYHLGKKHLYQLHVFNIPLGSRTSSP